MSHGKKGHHWQPPKEINPNPPGRRLPPTHPEQGVSGTAPTHDGPNTNLSGMGGRSTTGSAADRRGGRGV